MSERRHVFVTGASSGIGESLARAFIADGAAVTLLARREDRLRALAAEAAGRSHVIVADLSRAVSAPALLDEAERALGPIEVLVNNAGVQIVEPAEATAWERGAELLTVDLLAPLQFTQEALRRMLPRKSGSIVNVSSMAALAPTPGMFFYNAAKGGLAAASEGLRAEAARNNVHVVTVYPGPVRSAMEAAAREKYRATAAVRFAPTGDADVLSKLVLAAIERKRPRVIYPRFYAFARWFPGISRWVTDKLTPPLEQPSP